MDNDTLGQRRNLRSSRRVWAASGTFTALALVQLAGQALAQTPPAVRPPNALKKLSLDELQAIEVTSVSRHREKLSETASAIQVITADDIRRAGATSIPEALRLASNLQVAQLKVLFMSGYTDAVISSHGLVAAGVEYLQKPFTADALQGRVRDVLDGG
jgi:outer membrane receptor protein involved in Fe transport